MAIELIKSPEYKIRKIREIRNYSQDYLAQNLSLSVRAYSKIETGETQLTIKRLNQIGVILEVNPLKILEFNEKMLFEDVNINVNKNMKLFNLEERPIEYYNKKIVEMENQLEYLREIFMKKLSIT